MFPRAAFALLSALLLAAGFASAEEPDRAPMLVRTWSTREGLPQDHVRAMARTRDGFLWLGTDGGLARFDGVNFKTYGLREGLGAVAVLALHEARDGTLWVGTQGGYVSALRGGRILRTYERTPALSAGVTMSFAEDATGTIWLATSTGVARLEGERFVLDAEAPGAGQTLQRTAYCDREGALWIGFGSAPLARSEDGRWLAPEAGGPRTALAFCEDSAGRLWIGDAERRLWCREADEWRSHALPAGSGGAIHSLTAMPDGTLWVALYRAGVFAFREGRFIVPEARDENLADVAETVLAGTDGRLWLGTSTKGLHLLTPRRIVFDTVDDRDAGSAANFIGALVESTPGELTIGTQGRGLYRWRGGVAEPLLIAPEIDRGLFGNALLRTRDGSVWAATSAGLFQFRDGARVPKSAANSVPGPQVWELCEDREDSFWVGKGNGDLFHLRGSGARKVIYGGGKDPIKGLAQEADGTLWIGTRGNGLFSLRGKESRRYGLADGLPSEIIRTLFFSGDGTLWVGTAGGGIAVRKNGRFHAITTEHGLPDDTISQFTTDDDGRLWVGTNRGLAAFSAAEVERMREGAPGELHPLIITRADGLASEEMTIVPPVKMADGRFAFATTRGVALLRPGDFAAEENAPPVFIDRILANDSEAVATNGKVTLPPGIERLQFEFTALHFGAPERLRFRSRLAGVDRDWSAPRAERETEYRHLAPGTYRFEVAATAGSAHWTAQPAALAIELAPQWWQTAAFRIAALTAGAVCVALAALAFERRRVRQRMAALERQQALDAERARIARDLHDDIGSTLTQVALLSELAESDLPAHPDRARGSIAEIFTTAKSVTRSLDEIVWAVNPAEDTLESFVQFLGAFAQNYARSAGLQIRLDLPGELPRVALPSAVRHHLYLASKEVLHNVVKHAGATEIRIRLALEERRFRLCIEDNGRGFDPAQSLAPGSDGLRNLERRLAQIGGRIACESAAGEGTHVEMLVPLGAPRS